MPRFVLLEHDHPFPHRDLFLEAGDTLRGWRLLGDPFAEDSVRAESSANHRAAYLDYEGPVSGGRGSVTRLDAGQYELVEEGPHVLVLDLRGRRLVGRFLIVEGDDEEGLRFQRST